MDQSHNCQPSEQNFPPYKAQTDRLDSEHVLYKPIVSKLDNKHPASYTTHRLIIVFTAVRNWYHLSQLNPVLTLINLYFKIHYTLNFHLHLDLGNGFRLLVKVKVTL